MQNLTNPRVNSSLTKRVAQLHNEGYELDFALCDNKVIICVQNSCSIAQNSFSVKLVDQVFDQLFKRYKYLHLIETDSGEKGILLSHEIYFDSKLIN
jgi:hypothetical protein